MVLSGGKYTNRQRFADICNDRPNQVMAMDSFETQQPVNRWITFRCLQQYEPLLTCRNRHLISANWQLVFEAFPNDCWT